MKIKLIRDIESAIPNLKKDEILILKKSTKTGVYARKENGIRDYFILNGEYVEIGD